MKYKCEFNLYHWIFNDSFDGSNIYGINYFADRFATFYYSKSTHQTTYICGSLDFHTHHECAYAAYVKEGKKSIKIFDTFASNSPRSLRLNLKLCIISHLKLLFRRFPISFFFSFVAYLDLNRKNAHILMELKPIYFSRYDTFKCDYEHSFSTKIL